jgi:protein-tyrosine-phosphatase
MKNILLVCTGNTCRSPMAKALLQKILQERAPGSAEEFHISSAGLTTGPGLPASKYAIAVMEERGIDIKGHRSQPVDASLVQAADLVLAMTDVQREYLWDRFPTRKENIFTLAEFAGIAGEVADPFGGGQAIYEECAAQLEYILNRVAERLLDR